jgi:hypothetical protein
VQRGKAKRNTFKIPQKYPTQAEDELLPPTPSLF